MVDSQRWRGKPLSLGQARSWPVQERRHSTAVRFKTGFVQLPLKSIIFVKGPAIVQDDQEVQSPSSMWRMGTRGRSRKLMEKSKRWLCVYEEAQLLPRPLGVLVLLLELHNPQRAPANFLITTSGHYRADAVFGCSPTIFWRLLLGARFHDADHGFVQVHIQFVEPHGRNCVRVSNASEEWYWAISQGRTSSAIKRCCEVMMERVREN